LKFGKNIATFSELFLKPSDTIRPESTRQSNIKILSTIIRLLIHQNAFAPISVFRAHRTCLLAANVLLLPARGGNSVPPNPFAGFEGPFRGAGEERGAKHRSVCIFYPDTVPPIHVVSYNVATDKPPLSRWRQVPVYF